MKLKDIVPYKEIRNRFNEELVLHQSENIREVEESHSDSFFHLSLNVWNRLIEVYRLGLDPFALSPFITSGETLLHRRIEKLIQEPIIRNVYCADLDFRNASSRLPEIMNVFLAHVYPNDLQIVNIMLINPLKPLKIRDC